jgi:hypothetical protein
MIYIDRIMRRQGDAVVSSSSIHRLLATSLVVSVKFHEDLYYSNAYYARVAALSLKELNSLEVTFLCWLNWDLDVSPSDYARYHALLASASERMKIVGKPQSVSPGQ